MQGEIDRLYGEFIGMVARGRKMQPVDVIKRGARSFEGGANAIASGLADASGGVNDALMALLQWIQNAAASADYTYQGRTLQEVHEGALAEVRSHHAAIARAFMEASYTDNAMLLDLIRRNVSAEQARQEVQQAQRWLALNSTDAAQRGWLN